MKRCLVLLVCLAHLYHAGTVCAAAVNIANGAPVIGGGGDYGGGGYNSGGVFSTNNVTNGQNAFPDNNQGSSITTEPGQDGSYWLGPQDSTTGYFVIDLGSPQSIGSFEIFNTHNTVFDDRGTGNFKITGSIQAKFLNATNGYDLDGTLILLAQGTLTEQSTFNAFLTPDVFSSLAAGPFRYLRFDALSIGALNDTGFPDSGVGLNELRVFNIDILSVPEPATLALSACGLLSLMALCAAKTYMIRKQAALL